MIETTINDAQTMRDEVAGNTARLRPGDEILGRYVVESELGQGGMGVVYQCLDKVGGVKVAVKGLPPEVSHNADEMEEVRANYSLVEGLRHPNICAIKTLEKDERGDYYLVMDLARGVNLNRWLRQHPEATDAEKLAILRQIASALDYAHARKIIHRDVKPENVMVADDGTAQVLDFGLAAQVRSSLSRTSQAVTSKSGTPGYKAPEQWLGRPQGPASDQYALGVIAYKLFAGFLPFDGDDIVVLGQAVLTAPVEPVDGVSDTVNAALAKSLAKKPTERFPSCAAFVAALEGRAVDAVTVPLASSRSVPTVKAETDIYLVEFEAKDLFERKVANGKEPSDTSLKEGFRRQRAFYSAATSALAHGDQVSARRLFAEFTKSVASYESAVAEAARKAEEARQAELARQREAARKAEEARQAELARQREEERKAEEARQAELSRQREVKRKAEAARQIVERRARRFKAVVMSIFTVLVLSGVVVGSHILRKERLRKEQQISMERLRKEQQIRKVTELEVERLAAGGQVPGDVSEFTLPGGAKMKFVWCPPGSFTMGSPTDEEGCDDDETQHRVTLTKGFWLGQYEVTQAQWKAVMGDNPSGFKGDDRPVDSVSWDDCQKFIAKCNATAKGVRFALPTEAQWEYACRAGSTGPYAGTGDLGTMGWYDGNSGGNTHPVGQKQPNAWNLYDMHGNVYEWCADWYGKYEGDGTNPTWPASGGGRVLRGGSWNYDASHCRSAFRSGAGPGFRGSFNGFRLLCSAGLHDGQYVQKTEEATNPMVQETITPKVTDDAAANSPTGSTQSIQQGLLTVGEQPSEPSAGKVREVVLPGGAKMKFVWCPPGSFVMGSPTDEGARDVGETPHQVALTKGFWLGQYEVTQLQWESVMGDNPSGFKGDDRPVDSVSWDDCQKFIAKCNTAAKGVRFALPTEAQWEYACRAGTTTPFSFGRALNGVQANCDGNFPYGTSEEGPYHKSTVPVGSYAPNAWGFYDMHGNVNEWCEDWYGAYYGDSTDPTGQGSGEDRVLRGGSWYGNASLCRSADRHGNRPDYRSSHNGFRLLCSAGPHGE